MTAWIYSDEGVSERSVSALLAQIKNSNTISAKDIIEGSWRKGASCIVMPGGRDIPYDRALRGPGNAQIRQFVESGGFYLGICAGAYYGTSKVEFELGTEIEVNEKRELGFYPGKSVGTLYPGFDYESDRGAHYVRVDDFYAVYNGGCGFPAADQFEHVRVLGRYADSNIPAIVGCTAGSGGALLSGLHLEYTAGTLSNTLRQYSLVCRGGDFIIEVC